MKKLIKKLENWAKKNKNKVKLLNKICDASYFEFDFIIGFLLIIGAGLKGLILYLEIKFFSLILSCLGIGVELFIKQWKEAKAKDEDKNNKKDYGHFYMNGKDNEK